MAKRIIGSTPKADGYRMPAEFEPQDGVWMLWPERNDNWRSGAKPAQETFCQVPVPLPGLKRSPCASAPDSIRMHGPAFRRRSGWWRCPPTTHGSGTAAPPFW